MGDLKQWARDNNPRLQLSSGENVVVKFVQWKMVPDTFNPGKEKIQYEFDVDGKQKFWESSSGKTATFFDHVEKGDFVKISATGEGLKRRYELQDSIDESGTFTKQDVADIEKDLAG